MNTTQTTIIGRPQSREIELTTLQEQILYATLMADASMTSPHKGKHTNATIQFEHSTKQEMYALWKADILGMKHFHRDRYDQRTDKVYHSVYCYSQASPTYTDLYNRVYGLGGGKTLDQELLYSLTAAGLVVFFADDGYTSYDGRRCVLHTEKYNYQENARIQKYFQDIWGLSPSIQNKPSQGGMKYILQFNVIDSYKLLNIMRPYIPTQDVAYKFIVKPYTIEPQWLKDLEEQ